jgi:hypothetical protein
MALTFGHELKVGDSFGSPDGDGKIFFVDSIAAKRPFLGATLGRSMVVTVSPGLQQREITVLDGYVVCLS